MLVERMWNVFVNACGTRLKRVKTLVKRMWNVCEMFHVMTTGETHVKRVWNACEMFRVRNTGETHV
jgi:hypothetical protein